MQPFQREPVTELRFALLRANCCSRGAFKLTWERRRDAADRGSPPAWRKQRHLPVEMEKSTRGGLKLKKTQWSHSSSSPFLWWHVKIFKQQLSASIARLILQLLPLDHHNWLNIPICNDFLVGFFLILISSFINFTIFESCSLVLSAQRLWAKILKMCCVCCAAVKWVCTTWLAELQIFCSL